MIPESFLSDLKQIFPKMKVDIKEDDLILLIPVCCIETALIEDGIFMIKNKQFNGIQIKWEKDKVKIVYNLSDKIEFFVIDTCVYIEYFGNKIKIYIEARP